MKLLLDELNSDNLTQLVQTPSRVVHVKHIRPHLYKHAAPTGSFFIQIQDANGKKIANSNSLSAADISASTYFHGYVRFDIVASLTPDTNYYIALRSTGYTFGELAYIGWCRDYEHRKYAASYTPNTGVSSALDFEIWERKLVTKGQA